MLGPGQRGVKRKLDDGEDDEEGPFSQDRESVFTISLCKLNRYRQIPDPSLRRSVLICNTLRYIEREMESRGLQCSSVTATAGFLPAIQTDNNMTLDPLPLQVHASSTLFNSAMASPLPVGVQTPTEVTLALEVQSQTTSHLQPMDLRTASSYPTTGYEKNLPGMTNSGRATPFPPSLDSDPCRTDSGALWSDTVDERCSSTISWSTVLDLSSQSETDFISVQTNVNTISSSSSSSNSSSTSNNLCTTMLTCPNSSLNSSSDSCSSSGSSGGSEIFGDIDLSLYDFDLLPLSPPNVRLTPLSAEELLRSFPNNEPLPAVPGNGCFKNEFLSEELDHIMHILVGM